MVALMCLGLAVVSAAPGQGVQPASPSRCAGQPAARPAAPGARTIDLAASLAAGQMRGANRTASALDGAVKGVRLNEAAGPGVAWIGGTDFANGTIEVDTCGRDLMQRSFLGVAFHRQDDATYEAVYLRPFNYRASDAAQHRHAVQYMALPDYDWPRLRQDFPDQFESAVAPSVDPAAWVPLRVVVTGNTVAVYAGAAAPVALSVRKLGGVSRGMIGLWVGNNSDGAFANLRITPAP